MVGPREPGGGAIRSLSSGSPESNANKSVGNTSRALTLLTLLFRSMTDQYMETGHVIRITSMSLSLSRFARNPLAHENGVIDLGRKRPLNRYPTYQSAQTLVECTHTPFRDQLFSRASFLSLFDYDVKCDFLFRLILFYIEGTTHFLFVQGVKSTDLTDGVITASMTTSTSKAAESVNAGKTTVGVAYIAKGSKYLILITQQQQQQKQKHLLN